MWPFFTWLKDHYTLGGLAYSRSGPNLNGLVFWIGPRGLLGLRWPIHYLTYRVGHSDMEKNSSDDTMQRPLQKVPDTRRVKTAEQTSILGFIGVRTVGVPETSN